jgi:hypothetical protein
MNRRSLISPQAGFWGICLIVTAWLIASLLFEIHQGWPVTGLQYAKRLVGWFVEFWLIRTLVLGMRRLNAAVER